jgi:hypothetical protein
VFKYQVYTGEVPPFVGEAVYVTEAPAQLGLALGEIDTEGFTFAVILT